MSKFNLTVAVDVKDASDNSNRIQMTFIVSSSDLDDMGGERELAIFLACEEINKHLPGKRPIFRTAEIWMRPLSDQAWSI